MMQMEQQISFGLPSLGRFLKKGNYSKIIVLCDEHTGKYCLPLLKLHIKNYLVVRIKSGEKHKSLETASLIWKALITHDADRRAILLNLGGGVITDMGGFCASTYLRGIDFVHIPTTLMAMADASIGGKTGIDFEGYKNFIGGFSMAVFTCIDPVFLKTLPARQLDSGAAELFKHALLQGKREVKKFLLYSFKNATEKQTLMLLKNSVKFKLSIVALDYKDQNSRKQLNAGHTVGHALESYFLLHNKSLLHGEAVALGLVAEAWIAHNFFELNYDIFLNVVFWYDLNYKKPDLREVNFQKVFRIMQKDKKNQGTEVTMALPVLEGKVNTDASVCKSQIMEALKFIAAF